MAFPSADPKMAADQALDRFTFDIALGKETVRFLRFRPTRVSVARLQCIRTDFFDDAPDSPVASA
jgi:hypothetical protein